MPLMVGYLYPSNITFISCFFLYFNQLQWLTWVTLTHRDEIQIFKKCHIFQLQLYSRRLIREINTSCINSVISEGRLSKLSWKKEIKEKIDHLLNRLNRVNAACRVEQL